MKFISMLWQMILTFIGQAFPLHDNRTRPAGIGLIYSFEADILPRRSSTPLTVIGRTPLAPQWRSAAGDSRQRFKPSGDEWQIWRENNRMLFRSSA